MVWSVNRSAMENGIADRLAGGGPFFYCVSGMALYVHCFALRHEMHDKMSTPGQGRMGLVPALGLSVLLHAGLLFVLYAPSPLHVSDAWGSIAIHLVFLPGPSDGGQDALQESAAVQPPAAPAPRSKAAQAKKNPAANAASKAATQNSAEADPENPAQNAGLGYASKSDVNGPTGAASANSVLTGFVSGAGSPVPLANPRPAYPELARQRGQEGTVLLLADVDEKGAAKSVIVQRSSGYGLLDAAALSAVGQWRFKPAYLAGVAVSAQVLVPVEFRLRN